MCSLAACVCETLPAAGLIEVGASAGLCLLVDRYSYDFGGHRIKAVGPIPSNAPTFPCLANATTPLPRTQPRIAWRAGLDLNPLNVNSEPEMAWLETLVWPGQEHRVHRLRAAIEIARADPPKIHQGNLLSALPAIASTAPSDAQLVIFHTAVLGYVPSQSDRNSFAAAVRRTGATWIKRHRYSRNSLDMHLRLQALGTSCFPSTESQSRGLVRTGSRWIGSRLNGNFRCFNALDLRCLTVRGSTHHQTAGTWGG